MNGKEGALKVLLIGFGVVQLGIGILQWAAPGTFFEEIGPFGPRNDHYLGDVATWYLALGAVAITAANRPSWRIPVLTVAVVQYALHSVNHLIDVDEADPGWLGPADLVALVLTAALLLWMLRTSEEGAPR